MSVCIVYFLHLSLSLSVLPCLFVSIYVCVYIYIQNFPCLCLSSSIMFLTSHICQHLSASVSFLLSARPSVLRLMTMCLCADARMHVKLASASSPHLSMRASSCSCQRLLWRMLARAQNQGLHPLSLSLVPSLQHAKSGARKLRQTSHLSSSPQLWERRQW